MRSPLPLLLGERCRGERGDRGSAEPILILPVVFVMVLGVVQAGMWAHAQHRAGAIASQALASARAFDGSTASAYERAEQAQRQLGGGVLEGMDVEVHRTSEQARVRVTGNVVGLVPGMDMPVSSEVSGPVERLTP
ncbi:pilus assembly protein [Nocardiopsis sp. EMB25]|uniref:TadE/TadG family type IV pilus assembly protein n=1 Tax=Nocardiopsis sp. EMB25 TaxID=2835867 RepID=UPI0022839A76|nr:TadE/TadG family type IV pilus assembly protein [Nocardiopsis sp. EMB25]MCY9787106.1 pilus assembly protein [Nocardiopsis sp. EMB25]